jgi:hypothetical protein
VFEAALVHILIVVLWCHSSRPIDAVFAPFIYETLDALKFSKESYPVFKTGELSTVKAGKRFAAMGHGKLEVIENGSL